MNAEVDGEHLSEDELDRFFQLLVIAGNDTTRNLLANTMLTLPAGVLTFSATHPYLDNPASPAVTFPIAATVTLRGDRMYEFLDRLFNVALPRVRDFRGVSTGAFDGRGNYTLGLKDQLIFPEVDYAKVDKMRGMNVTFVTSARTDEESRLLLQYLGMPFRTQPQ